MLWAEHTLGAEHAVFISVTLVYVYRPSPTLFNKPENTKKITLLYPTTFCLHNYIPLTYSPPPLTPSQLTSPYLCFNTHFTVQTTKHLISETLFRFFV